MWPTTMTKPKTNTVHPLKGDMAVAVTSQPTSRNNKQEEYPDIPEGLEALEKTQHLFIKQSVSSTVESQYEVLNSEGEKIFMADETTDTSTKAWCRGTKPFDVSILIRSGMYRKEVMKLDGEPRSCGCGGDITLRSTWSTFGIVEHGTDCSSLPQYFVRDAEGREILNIVGPPSTNCFSFSLAPGAEFDVYHGGGGGTGSSGGGRPVIGRIAKYWGGQEKETLLKSDIWGVKFPIEMPVTHKALLLAACFLLNFQYQNAV